jgi:hypothetical protein
VDDLLFFHHTAFPRRGIPAAKDLVDTEMMRCRFVAPSFQVVTLFLFSPLLTRNKGHAFSVYPFQPAIRQAMQHARAFFTEARPKKKSEKAMKRLDRFRKMSFIETVSLFNLHRHIQSDDRSCCDVCHHYPEELPVHNRSQVLSCQDNRNNIYGDTAMSPLSFFKRRSIAERVILLMFVALLGASPALSRNFVVTSAEDAGVHTLRWAIQQANASPGPDVISFNIPGPGPHRIMLRGPLPALTDDAGVIIDGLTQVGSNAGGTPPSSMSLTIEVDGTHAGGAQGLLLQSSNNIVQGLVFMNFAYEGIRLHSAGQEVENNIIRYCMIGVDAEARPAANASRADGLRKAGILVYSEAGFSTGLRRNQISHCLVSGNAGDGIILQAEGGAILYTIIRGNYIGVGKAATSALANAGNGISVFGNCASNEINSNVIAGNHQHGIRLAGVADNRLYVQRNSISYNSIGVGRNQTPIGNGQDGVNIGGKALSNFEGFARLNTINGNTIAANGRNGITVWEHATSTDNADGNRLTGNSIYANQRLPIDLDDNGISLPGMENGGHGANASIPSPTIVSAEFTGGVAIVKGALNSMERDNTYAIELFRFRGTDSRKTDASQFLGAIQAGKDGNWVFSTSGSLVEGDSVFATVTDAHGNTSEFCSPRPLQSSLFAAESQALALMPCTTKASVVTILAVQPNPVLEYTEFSIMAENDTWAVMQVLTPHGELVETIYDRWLTKGEHTVKWNAKNWRGERLKPGWYVVIADADATRSQLKFEVGDVTIGTLDR